MLKLTFFLKTVVCILLVITAGVYTKSVQADELILSATGNGESSSNSVNVSASQTSSVNQSADATAQNTITSAANTGSNTASSNGGSTSVTSGSVNTQVGIANQNINSNTAQAGTSNVGGTATISGNGQNSMNAIVVGSNNGSSVTQHNTAQITNFSSTGAVTGGNHANTNAGWVSIQTGNIYSSTDIINKNINNSSATVGSGGLSMNAVMSGNGENSENLITVVSNSKNTIDVTNTATITNTDLQYLTTGNNSANDNLGGVFLLSGNIVARKSIENTNINSSIVEVTPLICETQKVSQPPTQTTVTPPTPSTNGGGGTGGVGGTSGSGSSTPGVVLGTTLPVTGAYWLFLLMLGNLIAFFSGWYLRFRSGVAPGFVIA